MSGPIDLIPWIEKYRPRRIRDVVQSDEIISLFENIMATGSLPHMLFYGPQGTGKTSSALALGREIFGDDDFRERIIEFNASDDRGINAVRDKIAFEARKSVNKITLPNGKIIPPYKIIILDEADSMTDEAQDALRVIIEEYSTVTRFCFICNYINKMTDAIKSRCSKIYFKRLSVECMKSKLSEISKIERMDDLPDEVISSLISVSSGDMRKAIMLLQNIKYEYEFRKHLSKPIDNMTLPDLKNYMSFPLNQNTSNSISGEDVYAIAGTISDAKSGELLHSLTRCKNIGNVRDLSRSIINMGYPVDSVIMQLNNHIIKADQIDNIQKAKILQCNSLILYRMKECANEYIQLLQYLSKIYLVLTRRDEVGVVGCVQPKLAKKPIRKASK